MKKTKDNQEKRSFLDFISHKDLTGINLDKEVKVPRDGFNKRREYFKKRVLEERPDKIWGIYQLTILGDINQKYL